MLAQARDRTPRNRIDLTTEELTRHWCKHFGASREELEAAVSKVGDNAETVLKELRNGKPQAHDSN